jgi:hypothetical protein
METMEKLQLFRGDTVLIKVSLPSPSPSHPMHVYT